MRRADVWEWTLSTEYVAEFDEAVLWVGKGDKLPYRRELGKQFLFGIYPIKLQTKVALEGFKGWYKMARSLVDQYQSWYEEYKDVSEFGGPASCKGMQRRVQR